MNCKNNKELEWFVGFSDAESNFYTTKKRDSQIFQIHLHIRDLQLLYYIKILLGFGNIYIDYKNERVCYMISDKKTLYNKLIPIFEKYPFLTRKINQYNLFKDILYKRYYKDNNYIINNWKLFYNNSIELIKIPYYSNWLMGFIEGEGSFFFYKK